MTTPDSAAGRPQHDDAYYGAVNAIINAARILRAYDLAPDDREAMRAVLRRARVLR